MATPVKMPELGESITEGTITRWLKQEGDQVEVDEPLFEVSTDKVDTEVPSPVAGVLEAIKAAVDDTVAVGAVVAEIASGAAEAAGDGGGAPGDGQAGDGGRAPGDGQAAKAPGDGAAAQTEAAETTGDGATAQADAAPTGDGAPTKTETPEATQAQAAAAAPQAAPTPAPAAPTEPPTPTNGGGEPVDGAGADSAISPLVRRLARENDVDLTAVAGSGTGGRVLRGDVEAYLQRRDATAAATPAADAAAPAAGSTPAPPQRAPAAAAPASAAPQAPAGGDGPREQVVPATRLRRIIAERMVASLQTSAQLTAAVEVDMTSVMRLRAKVRDDFKRSEGMSLSPLPFCVMAMIAAVRDYPNTNSALDADGNLHVYRDIHLGVAVDTPKGLFVPVIKNADALNITGVARAIADVAKRTRAGRIDPGELAGSTITVTNTGSVGTVWDTPIINQPNAVIVATPAIVKRPVVMDDPELGEIIAVRHMMYAIVTYDHRILDGADAARFLGKLKEVLETADFGAELGVTED